MLIAIAAAAALSSAVPAPTVEPRGEEKARFIAEIQSRQAALAANRCSARVLSTNTPSVRYDQGAADAGAADRQPYRGDVQLFSAVELKVDGCSLPVIRARATAPAAIEPQAVPLDH